MVCCYLVKVPDKSFSVFCNQKLVSICGIEEKEAFQCFWRNGRGRVCKANMPFLLTDLHAGHLLERQVWRRVWL